MDRKYKMANRLRDFWRWLFPAKYSEFATCKVCGSVGYKSRMKFIAGHGWFCDDEEAESYWESQLL